MNLRALALAALLLPAPAFAQGTAQETPPPVAAPPAADWTAFKNPYAGARDDIATPHRSNEEISALATQKAGEALSFPMEDFNGYIKTLKPSFVQDGWMEYAAYLKAENLLDLARSGKYVVGTAADGDARVLSSAPVNGAWRWEVNVPVITSVSQPDLSGELQTVSSTRLNLRLTLVRVPTGNGEAAAAIGDGLAIIGWKKGAERQ